MIKHIQLQTWLNECFVTSDYIWPQLPGYLTLPYNKVNVVKKDFNIYALRIPYNPLKEFDVKYPDEFKSFEFVVNKGGKADGAIAQFYNLLKHIESEIIQTWWPLYIVTRSNPPDILMCPCSGIPYTVKEEDGKIHFNVDYIIVNMSMFHP